MAKHISSKKETSLQSLAFQRLEQLRGFRQEILSECNKLNSRSKRDTQRNPLSTLFEIARNSIEAICVQTVSALGRMKKQKIAAQNRYRKFQITHGIKREATRPDLLKTVLVVQSAILAEGLLTAGLMIGDGKMDIVMGLTYGLSVSAINVATGLMAGFLARYVTYKINTPFPKPEDKRIRNVAWLSFAGFVATMTLLHFSAARVRALGSHTGLFDFSEISFMGTFDSYYAIAIVVVGTLGSILAVYEGLTGLSDPIPGYTQARKAAEEEISAATEEIHLSGFDRAEMTYEEACENIEDAVVVDEDDREMRLTLNNQIAGFDDEISNTVDLLHVLQAEDLAQREYIAQKKLTPAPIQFDVFEALRMEEIPLAQPCDASDLLAELHKVYAQATSDIEEAYSDFLTQSIEFDFDDQS